MNLFSDLDLDVQSISYDHLFCLNSYHPSSQNEKVDIFNQPNDEKNCATSVWIWNEQEKLQGSSHQNQNASIQEMRSARESQELKIHDFIYGFKPIEHLDRKISCKTDITVSPKKKIIRKRRHK